MCAGVPSSSTFVASDATRATGSAQIINLLVRRLIQNGVATLTPNESPEEEKRDVQELAPKASTETFSRADILVRLAILRTDGPGPAYVVRTLD